MATNNYLILVVHITDRIHNVSKTQDLLTEYGCSIRTRLGLHEAGVNFCSPNGLIILEMVADDPKSLELAKKLNKLKGVECKTVSFEHA